MNFFIPFFVTFFGLFIGVPIFFWLLRSFGLYAIVEEGTHSSLVEAEGVYARLYKGQFRSSTATPGSLV